MGERQLKLATGLFVLIGLGILLYVARIPTRVIAPDDGVAAPDSSPTA